LNQFLIKNSKGNNIIFNINFHNNLNIENTKGNNNVINELNINFKREYIVGFCLESLFNSTIKEDNKFSNLKAFPNEPVNIFVVISSNNVIKFFIVLYVLF
jgi:hypothetical protein